jgi:hypothetical protein
MISKKLAKGATYIAAFLAVCFGLDWGFEYILTAMVGGRKSTTRRMNELRTGKESTEESERRKVLARDPRAVLAGLDTDTRASIDRAEARGIDAGLEAARKALHRRGDTHSGQGGG